MKTRSVTRPRALLVGLATLLLIPLMVAVPARAEIFPDTAVFKSMLTSEQARSLGVAARNTTSLTHIELMENKRKYVAYMCPEQYLTGKSLPAVVYDKTISSNTKSALSPKKQTTKAYQQLNIFQTAADAEKAFGVAQRKVKKCTGMQDHPGGFTVEASNGSGTLANGNAYYWYMMESESFNQMTIGTLTSAGDTRWYQLVQLETSGNKAPKLTQAQQDQLREVASEATETTGLRAEKIWEELVRCFNKDFGSAAGLCL